jgi:hypothetical protein
LYQRIFHANRGIRHDFLREIGIFFQFPNKELSGLRVSSFAQICTTVFWEQAFRGSTVGQKLILNSVCAWAIAPSEPKKLIFVMAREKEAFRLAAADDDTAVVTDS